MKNVIKTIIISVLTFIATMVVCNVTTANAQTCPTCLPDAFDYVDFDSSTYARYYNSDNGDFDIDYNTACDIVQAQFEYYAKHNHLDTEDTTSPATTTITSDTTTTTTVLTTTVITSDTTTVDTDTSTTTDIVTSVTTVDTTTSTSNTTATSVTTTLTNNTTTTSVTTTTISTTTDTTTSDSTNTTISDNTNITTSDNTNTTVDTITSDTTISGDTTTSDNIDIDISDTTTNLNPATSDNTTDPDITIDPDALKKLLADIKIYIDNNNSVTIDYQFKDIYKYVLRCGQHHLTIDLFY